MSAPIPEDILDRIALEVSTLTSSAAWQEYLRYQAALYRYSFCNTLLIRHAGGTQVAGFHRWRTLGRHVRKGARGIAILAPVRGPADRDRCGSETDDQRLGAEHVVGFRVVHVFDVSATDGRPLPEMPCHRLTGDAPDDLVRHLVDVARGLGYAVDLDAIFHNPSTNGQTAPVERWIAIRPDLAPAQRVKTLAHELAHVLLHGDALASGSHYRELGELEAESVAYIVCGALGIDSGDYSFCYLACWLDGLDPLAALRHIGERVQRTAREILDALEALGGAAAK